MEARGFLSGNAWISGLEHMGFLSGSTCLSEWEHMSVLIRKPFAIYDIALHAQTAVANNEGFSVCPIFAFPVNLTSCLLKPKGPTRSICI